MYRPRTRRADTDAQFSCVLCVSAGHESGTLFVANQDKSNFVLTPAKRV